MVVKPEDSEWRVVVNGVYHSWLPYGGVHSLLGALPAMMHPNPRDVVVIGLGSGDTGVGRGEPRGNPKTSGLRNRSTPTESSDQACSVTQ